MITEDFNARINITISGSLVKLLDTVCKRQGESRSSFIRKLLIAELRANKPAIPSTLSPAGQAAWRRKYDPEKPVTYYLRTDMTHEESVQTLLAWEAAGG